MAEYKGVNYTKYETPTADNITDPGELDGKVRVMTDSYEATGQVAGSTIKMGKPLPGGARILNIILAMDALGGSSTLAVGDAVSAARYLAASDSSSAIIREMSDGTTVDGLLHEITTGTDDVIIITTAGGTITGTIKIIVEYTYE
jgi:hypothetical protein